MSEGIDLGDVTGRGFLARDHHKLRFTELGENFFGRVLLAKCSDPTATELTTVQLSICDLFRRHTADELTAVLSGETFSEAPKVLELVADVFGALSGEALNAHAKEQPALDYYQDHIASRLKWLRSGDEKDNRLPSIEAFTARAVGNLSIFDVTLRPATLRQRLSESIPHELELAAKLVQKLLSATGRPGDPGARIDHRKEVELLTDYLEERQSLTGETAFSLLSSQIPFRWALQHVPAMEMTLPAIATATVDDKILLPLFLEVNGLIDIDDLDLESDPRRPNDTVIRYSIRKPAARNVFGASNAGLSAATRARLNETELALYHRLHRAVREGLAFGGKPNLEMSFGALCASLVRKACYCIEEPTFVAHPARDWLRQHAEAKTLQMEDQFFLPLLYERMRGEFGPRVVKKPERFGGEIDLLFDDTIPVELKVRRGRREPLNAADVHEKFRPAGQAAAYAAVSRVGFVVVLDLPNDDTGVVNLESCGTVVERRFPETAEYPTCIVLIVFRCSTRTPSSTR